MQAHRPLALADGVQALRVVREHATRGGLRVDRVGMLSFSAGANLAAGVALASTADSRHAFVAPIYGGLREDIVAPTHAWTPPAAPRD